MTYQPDFDEIRTAALRRLFEVYTDPMAANLVDALDSVLKAKGPEWVEDLIRAMGVHDAGLFPAEWFPPDEDDAFEAYNNSRMQDDSGFNYGPA